MQTNLMDKSVFVIKNKNVLNKIVVELVTKEPRDQET